VLRQDIVRRVECIRAYRAARRCGRNFVHAMQPADFLNQIHLAFQVHPEGRDLKLDRFRRGIGADWARLVTGGFQTKLAEVKLNFFRPKLDAEQFVHLVMPQRDLFRLDRIRIGVHEAFGELAAGGLENQLRAARAGPVVDVNVRAALETIAGVGAQSSVLLVRRMFVGEK